MNDSRYLDWLSQAESDLAWARDSVRGNFYSQVCFVCQQVAEKSLKSLAIKRGFDYIRIHSVLQIARELRINGKIADAGKKLDGYYISARYPDAFPAGAPHEFFSKEQALEAIEMAQLIFDKCSKLIREPKRRKMKRSSS